MKSKKIIVTREQKRALLVQAKTYLARYGNETLHVSRTQFICWAIDLAVHDRDTYLVGRALKDLIRERLGGYALLEWWAEEKHGIHERHYTSTCYQNKMQETRHAWIDSLIKEFS